MSALFDKSVREVTALSASAAPTPGGGSVSAIVACLGLAMSTMVCNLTTGKKKYLAYEAELQEIAVISAALMEKLEEAAERDMREFANYMTAFRLPKENESEKSKRAEAMQRALTGATETPLNTARVCLEALQLTRRVCDIGNKVAISDAGVAAVVLDAALNGVLLSVEINAVLIKDPAYVARVAKEKESLLAESKRLRDEIMLVVQARMMSVE